MFKSYIEAYIDAHKKEALSVLEDIVNIESYTKDSEGVNKVNKCLREWLDKLGFTTKIIENDQYGNHLIANIDGTAKNGKVLLMGHMDTAHPTGTLEKFPLTKTEKTWHGPGLSDMKSGNVSMILAAKALYETHKNEISKIEILLTPDEEEGSPISRNIIPEYARDSKAVFNLEAGRPDGTVVNKRKGSAHLSLEILGKASHSGAFYEDGISANDELARKMIEIKQLESKEKDLTINFGVIKGGQSNNIVSPFSSATLHLAFWETEDFDEVFEDIKNIVDTPYIEGTRAKLSGKIGILPMSETENVKKLLKIYLQTAEELGVHIESKPTKGASDAGFAAEEGVPVICGVGPVGGKWHTSDEYMEINTFSERTNVLAHSILKVFKEL